MLDARENSLNAVRLALAAAVVVSHSWPVGGFGDDPRIGDSSLGDWAVAGFFAISGYLITSSRLHSSLGSYLWRRVLRIYPAFLVVLVVTAFLLSPLVAGVTGDGPWQWTSALRYVWGNAALNITQFGISETLVDVPLPDNWNGSLWTLFYEFVCYLLVAAAWTLSRRRIPILVMLVIATLATCATVSAISVSGDLPQTIELLCRLCGFFSAGSLLFLLRDRVVVHWSALTAAGVALFVLAALHLSASFAGLPVAYLILVLGASRRFAFVGRRNDISYGLYIYAFPVQQALSYALAHSVAGPLAFAVCSLAVVLPVAWASWLFIERPALKLRRLRWRTNARGSRSSEEGLLSDPGPGSASSL